MTTKELKLGGEVGLRGTARAEVPRYTTMMSANGEKSHAVLEGSNMAACGRDARGWVPLLHLGELLWQIDNKHTSDSDTSLDGVPIEALSHGDGPPPALEPTCRQCARRCGTWVPIDPPNRQQVMDRAYRLYEERAEQAEGEWGATMRARVAASGREVEMVEEETA